MTHNEHGRALRYVLSLSRMQVLNIYMTWVGPRSARADHDAQRDAERAGQAARHTLEKPLLEPQAKMRSDAEFEPIRGFEIFPTGWAPAPKVIPRRGLFRRRTSHRRHRAAAD